MDLDSMKYAELRSLAKQHGLKANMKADKLLKALQQHFQKEKEKEEQGQGKEAGVSASEEDENADECRNEVPSTSVFVNTRRGKGNGTKRRISDTVPEADANIQPSADEDDNEVTAPSPSCGARDAKKRRVSSPRVSEITDNEMPATSSEPHGIKDEAPVPCNTGDAPNVAKAGRIPRYRGLQNKNKPLLKPVTPNFKKLHEAHFNKMESIDSYVQRKTKQMETFRNSVKELKMLSDKTKLQKVDGKTKAKGKPSRSSVFNPVPEYKRPAEDKRRVTLLSASKTRQNKPPGKEDAPFRPSVLSTRRINVRFSEATRDNEPKKSLAKTPSLKSPCVISSTPLKRTGDGGKPSNIKTTSFSATKSPGTFVFNGNTSLTPGTQKKQSFDLKASLSRPLSYKPHTGKLKPFGEANENSAANGSLISNSHQKNYKQHKVQTRADRRAKQTEDRKQKKESLLGARRGLVML